MAEEHEEWTPYQKMEAGILKDISCDTDEILKKLEGVKMGEGFDTGNVKRSGDGIWPI